MRIGMGDRSAGRWVVVYAEYEQRDVLISLLGAMGHLIFIDQIDEITNAIKYQLPSWTWQRKS